MGLIQGWWLWVWLAAAVLAVGFYLGWIRRRRRVVRPGRLPLARTAALTETPRYRQLRRRYRALSAGAAVAVGVVAVSGMLLSARPASTRTVAGAKSNRDVMLCLDISTSMQDLDVAVLKTFDTIAHGLRGQRIGLVVFNAFAVLKFPLTDDYGFVHDQLLLAEDGIAHNDPTYFGGTLDPRPNGTASLIGDGLATCTQSFDQRGHKRARSIILATDGEPGPGSVYPIAQAGGLARRAAVRVYCLNRVGPAHQDLDYDPQGYRDLQLATSETDGGLYDASDPRAVGAIESKILRQEASRLKTPPTRLRADRPTAFAIAALIAVAALVGLSWRLER